MKKFICLGAAITLACTAVGCGEKKSPGNLDVPDGFHASQDELPYGSVTAEIKPGNDGNVKVMVCFDRRYFGGEGEDADLGEVYKLTDCIAGLNANDHELLKGCYYPGYLEKSAEGTGYADVDAYLDAYHEDLVKKLGNDFEIDYIDISQCYLTGDSEGDSYFEIADSILTEIAGEGILDKVTSRKLAEIGGYTTFKADGSTKMLTNYTENQGAMQICVYKIDGEYYLF